MKDIYAILGGCFAVIVLLLVLIFISERSFAEDCLKAGGTVVHDGVCLPGVK